MCKNEKDWRWDCAMAIGLNGYGKGDGAAGQGGKRRLRCYFWLAVMMASAFAWPSPSHAAEPEVIYQTGFEPSEGFDLTFTLGGQDAWLQSETWGNGLVTNFFEGMGQQAFVGFFPPEEENEGFVNVWRPLNVDDPAAGGRVIRFRVLMEIIDSTETNANYDCFRWSVYNNNSENPHRFFTIDFDNENLSINYDLDDAENFVSTGFQFQHGGLYELEVLMDFANNEWSALLEDVRIVNAKPITTTGAELTLGDVDAVWFIKTLNQPGDNYMLFDDYRVERVDPDGGSEPDPVEVTLVSRQENGQVLIRVNGEPNTIYAVEATTDFQQWTEIDRGQSADGVVEALDTGAPNFDWRFYRAREE